MKTKQEIALKDKFNSMFKIGDTVRWRSSRYTIYRDVTVKSEAFMNYATAVVYFEDISGFCSIDPEFLIYPKAR